LYTAQKNNSHYAPQPYTDQSVLKNFFNCTGNQLESDLIHLLADKNEYIDDSFVVVLSEKR